MSRQRISLNQSLWIYGGFVDGYNRHAWAEIAALRARGAECFILKSPHDRAGLEQLRRRLGTGDTHAILLWLHPRELGALRPIFQERRNFSVVLDDWWIIPPWFLRHAEYRIFRKYSGLAVRLGQSPFVCDAPPWRVGPVPPSPYATFAKCFRLPALAASPVVDGLKWFQRRGETLRPESLIYFPFTLEAGTLPLEPEEIQYDFGVSGSTCGLWIMRDPFAPFQYTFANLYYDRFRLVEQIGHWEGRPYRVYNWRRNPKAIPPKSWEDYLRTTRQCRYVVSTGGLHNVAVPKYMEYACVGTPMIGRKLPFEYPWLDDCLFPVDIMRLTPETLKPLLDEALARYEQMRRNCLKWRSRLFELYEPHRLLDLVQAQIDGQPVPPDYLTEKGIACDRIRTGASAP